MGAVTLGSPTDRMVGDTGGKLRARRGIWGPCERSNEVERVHFHGGGADIC